MNGFKLTLIVVTVAWLQLATLPAMRPLGVVPNLALVVIVLLAARQSLLSSLVAGASIGLLLDLGAGSDFGLRTSFYLLLVLSVGMLKQIGSDLDNLSLQASVVMAGTVLVNLAILANLALLRVSLPPRYIAWHVLAELIGNLLLLVPVRWLLGKIIGHATEIVVAIGGKRG